MKFLRSLFGSKGSPKVSSKAIAGWTRLHEAASMDELWEVEELLDGGKADVNAIDRNGDTPLHAAARGCHRRVAELLLAKGAKIDARNFAGETPLFAAASFNVRTGVTEVLLDGGADVNAKNVSGETPLRKALRQNGGGGGDVAALLRQHGGHQ